MNVVQTCVQCVLILRVPDVNLRGRDLADVVEFAAARHMERIGVACDIRDECGRVTIGRIKKGGKPTEFVRFTLRYGEP